jgi:threonine/homoserine/homoserine lactone efflux protein
VVFYHDRVGGDVSAVLSVAGLVTLAAVTPGPNNLIVLRAASRAGVRGALPAIAGVVLGGLAVLAVALVASDAAFAAEPRLRIAAGAAGCLYLMWLGLDLVRGAGRPSSGPTRGLPAASVAGLFSFQFLNPKSWVMVMTAIGAMPAGDAPWWSLGAVFTVIPATCLLSWAIAGAALTRWLAQPRIAVWVDRAMGVLLIATAIALVELP